MFPAARLSGSGTLYLDSSSDVEVNDLYLDRPLVNNGQAMMFGHIHLGAGASLSNAAGASLTLEIGTLDGIGSLVNQGTLVKATSPYGPGTVSINVRSAILPLEQCMCRPAHWPSPATCRRTAHQARLPSGPTRAPNSTSVR